MQTDRQRDPKRRGRDDAAFSHYLRVAGNAGSLSTADERDLVRRAQGGDRCALDRCVGAYAKTVAMLAMPLRRGPLTTMDLVAEGNVALAEAVQAYRAEHDGPFRAFALRRVVQRLARANNAASLTPRVTAPRVSPAAT